jgi:hypothetical protein
MSAREQRATVDRRSGALIVCSYSKTTAGFWIMNGHYDRLPDDIDEEHLGVAVLTALDASKHGVAVPSRTGTPFDPVLRELGLRSYGQYMTGTAQVAVTALDGVTIAPNHNGGTRQGFTEIEADTEVIHDPRSISLAAGVHRGLARAT